MKAELCGVLLAVCMAFAIMPTTVYAQTIFGDGYSFDTETGKLYIESDAGPTAWRENPDIPKEAVLSVELQRLGTPVLNIGDNAFADCTNLTGTIKINGHATRIGKNAFQGCENLDAVWIPESAGADIETAGIPDSVAYMVYEYYEYLDYSFVVKDVDYGSKDQIVYDGEVADEIAVSRLFCVLIGGYVREYRFQGHFAVELSCRAAFSGLQIAESGHCQFLAFVDGGIVCRIHLGARVHDAIQNAFQICHIQQGPSPEAGIEYRIARLSRCAGTHKFFQLCHDLVILSCRDERFQLIGDLVKARVETVLRPRLSVEDVLAFHDLVRRPVLEIMLCRSIIHETFIKRDQGSQSLIHHQLGRVDLGLRSKILIGANAVYQLHP